MSTPFQKVNLSPESVTSTALRAILEGVRQAEQEGDEEMAEALRAQAQRQMGIEIAQAFTALLAETPVGPERYTGRRPAAL